MTVTLILTPTLTFTFTFTLSHLHPCQVGWLLEQASELWRLSCGATKTTLLSKPQHVTPVYARSRGHARHWPYSSPKTPSGSQR